MKHELYILVLIVIVIIIVYLTMVAHARLSGRTFHEDLLGSMYGSVFPEEEFSSSDEVYLKELEHGRKIASNSSLCIGGLAYNLSEEQVIMLEKRLDYIAEGWKEVTICVYGLDSKEPFRSHLIAWSQRDSKVQLVPPINRVWKNVNVFTKMASLRDILHKHMININADYFLTIDYDIGGPISRDGLHHAVHVINTDPKIAAVYANGVVSDSFINTIPGLKGWCFPGLGYSYYDDLALIVEAEDETKLYKWFYMTHGRGHEPIAIKSAYGGAGLFRREALLSATYEDNTQRCEHHSFNFSLLRQGYKLIVDPSFLLLAGCQGHHLTRRVE